MIKRNKVLNYFKQNCPIFRFAIQTGRGLLIRHSHRFVAVVIQILVSLIYYQVHANLVPTAFTLAWGKGPGNEFEYMPDIVIRVGFFYFELRVL